MNTLAVKKSTKKTPLGVLQATFNRHRRKIEQLRNQREELEKECAQALALYHSELKPKEKKAGKLVVEFIHKITDLTHDPKALNKKEKIACEDILKESLNLAFSIMPYGEIDDKLKSLYKKIFGEDSDKDFYEEMSNLKEMIKEQSVVDDIDMSHLDPNDSMEEIFVKLAHAFQNAKMSNEAPPPPPPPPQKKSKKQLLKEENERALAELQNKGLNSIYKRLAKAFHPDLEQDHNKRAEKVALMKRLTAAYENQDLLSLLTLESEWLGAVETSLETLGEEKFKAYNALLKDQIEDLKQEMILVTLHPRYLKIHPHIKDSYDRPLEGIHQSLFECKQIIDTYSSRLADLSGKNPLKFLKEVLSEGQELNALDIFFDELFFSAKKIHR